MKVVDILTAAHSRLSDKNNWTTGCLALAKESALDGAAFCAIGSVLKEGGAYPAAKNSTEPALVFDEYRAAKNSTEPALVFDELYRDIYRANSASADIAENAQATLLALSNILASLQSVDIATRESNLLVSIGAIKDELANYPMVHSRTIITALKYLQAAARIVGHTGGVVGLNDGGRTDSNHRRVLAMFSVAIKNAKRRHRNGTRYASAPVAVNG